MHLDDATSTGKQIPLLSRLWPSLPESRGMILDVHIGIIAATYLIGQVRPPGDDGGPGDDCTQSRELRQETMLFPIGRKFVPPSEERTRICGTWVSRSGSISVHAP